MRLLRVLIIFLLMTVTSNAGVIDKTKTFIFSDWMERGYLKYGMVTSLCLAQMSSGLVESYRFNGRHIVSDSDYHVYRTMQSVTWLSAGWFAKNNVMSKKLRWHESARNIIGSACLARNCFELAYRANMTGDPFNYADTSYNRKALIYFKWDSDNHRFVDMYISGVGRQGVFIDAGFFLLAFWLL